MTVPLSGTSPVPDRDRLLELALALSAATPLLARLEQVTLAALELTGTDHADLTVFDPLLRRLLPRHSNRVFLHDGDDEAAAWIRQHRSRLLVERVADAVTDSDLMLLNRDISSYLGVPVLVDGNVEAALLVFSKEPRAFDAGEPARLDSLAALAGLVIDRHRLQLEVRKSRRLLRRLDLVDAATGFATGTQYRQLLGREWDRSVQDGHPLALLLVDIQPGNSGTGTVQLSAHAVRLLRAALYRPDDVVAQLDPFRLALLLPETDERGALALARRLRRSLHGLPALDGEDAPVSLRIGIAAFASLHLPRAQQLRPEDLHRRAEEALGRAAALDSGEQLFSLSLA